MDFEELVKKYPVGTKVTVHGDPGEVRPAREYLDRREVSGYPVLASRGSVYQVSHGVYVVVRLDDGYLSGWLGSAIEPVTYSEPENEVLTLIGQLIEEAEERGYQRALLDVRAQLDELTVIK